MSLQTKPHTSGNNSYPASLDLKHRRRSITSNAHDERPKISGQTHMACGFYRRNGYLWSNDADGVASEFPLHLGPAPRGGTQERVKA
jgi:hypothetical protein